MMDNARVAKELVAVAKALIGGSRQVETLQKLANRVRYFGAGYEYEIKEIDSDQYQIIDKHGEPIQLVREKALPMSNIPAPYGGWKSVFDYRQVMSYLRQHEPASWSQVEKGLRASLLNRDLHYGVKSKDLARIAFKYGVDEDDIQEAIDELIEAGKVSYDERKKEYTKFNPYRH
jgi:hypothetical protein